MSAAYGAPAHGCWIGASRARTVAGHDHSPYRNHSDRPPRYLAVLSPPQLMQDFLVEAGVAPGEPLRSTEEVHAIGERCGLVILDVMPEPQRG